MTVLNQLGHVENPSARIQFLQVAQTAPGQCGICGKGQDERGFADTQLDFEFWGRLILCCDCVEQIAAVFGFISSSSYEELLGERDLSVLELHEANERVVQLERIISGFTNLRTDFHTVSSGTISGVEVIEQTPELNEPSDTIEPDPIPGIDDNFGQTSGQSGETPKSPGKPRLLNI